MLVSHDCHVRNGVPHHSLGDNLASLGYQNSALMGPDALGGALGADNFSTVRCHGVTTYADLTADVLSSIYLISKYHA
jgi:hypothetical protein